MRVLITGGAGYVGSHTVWALLEEGYEPAVFDDLSQGHARAIPYGVPLFQGNLGEPAQLKEALKSFRPAAVMHFAGRTLVGESVQKPGLYYRANLAYGLNLLDAMVEHGVSTLIFSSTAAVYGEPIATPITEEHPTLPTNPYGESKLFFEKVLARYEKAHGIRYAALRYFNAAGAHPSGRLGEDHNPETHLIPIILQVALGQRDNVTVFGGDYPTEDGTCIRDYVHVCDLARAHILALEHIERGGASDVFNLGSGKGFSVREVISTVERVVGRTIPHELGPRRPGDPAVLVASAEKARKRLGWQPAYPTLEEIVETAWLWHSTHPHGFSS